MCIKVSNRVYIWPYVHSNYFYGTFLPLPLNKLEKRSSRFVPNCPQCHTIPNSLEYYRKVSRLILSTDAVRKNLRFSRLLLPDRPILICRLIKLTAYSNASSYRDPLADIGINSTGSPLRRSLRGRTLKTASIVMLKVCRSGLPGWP
jgi:hypothetical protein